MIQYPEASSIEEDFSSMVEAESRRGAPLWQSHGGLVRTLSVGYGGSGASQQIARCRLKMLHEALGLPENSDIAARCRFSGSSAQDLEAALGSESDGEISELVEDREIFRLSVSNGELSESLAESVPFERLLSPMARRVFSSFFDTVQSATLVSWSSSAREDFYKELLLQIVSLCSHALLHELQIFRSTRDVGERAALAAFTGHGGEDLYAEFLREISRDQGRSFYRRYPVLLRLLSIRIRNWRQNTSQVLKALHDDRLDLERELGIHRNAVVEGVEFGLSDPHHGGRAVVVVRMESHAKVVFKPRSLGPDAAFMRVANYLNNAAGKQLFKIVTYIEKQSYGWMEFVSTSKVCSDKEQVTYYERVGSLLALLHAFRATDCHNENLFVVDGFPLMIDLETVAHPDYGLLAPRARFTGGYFDFLGSVARIGLLPVMKSDQGEVDISAVGSVLVPQIRPVLRYEGIGNIYLDLKMSHMVLDVGNNSPSDQRIDTTNIVRAMQSGFREAYELICEQRAVLLREPTLLPSLRSCEVRFVARPSRLYGWLLQRAQDATALRSGIDWSLEMERLYRVCVHSSIQKEWTKIADAERRALEGLDIPRFTVPVTKRLIRAGSTTVLKQAFARSPWQLLRSRLRDLGPNDLATQLRIIDLSFAQRGGESADSAGSVRAIAGRQSVADQHRRVIEKAHELVQAVESSIVSPSGKGGTWLTLSPMSTSGEYRLEAAGPGLYQGNAGIGLFLAAAYAVEPVRHYRDLAREVLHALVTPSSREGEDQRPWDIGIGRAGISYALFRGGCFLKDRALKEAAYEMIASVEDETLQTTDQVDVISGLAGYILVAELISRCYPNPELTRKVGLAASRVCELEQVFSPQQSAWNTLEGKPLPGFAHGSAGISYALVRAGTRLGIAGRPFLQCARRAFRNERFVFDGAQGNWCDLRGDIPGFTAPSWCHGAVGIGLASAASADILTQSDYDDVLARSRAVIESEVKRGLRVHSLCCGAPGILEYFLALPAACRDESLLYDVKEHLLSVSAYRYFDRTDSRSFLPGMFVGGAGVGYQLLRTEFPDLIPSILTFS